MPIQVGRGEWNTMWCDPNAAESDARSRFKDSELSKSESRILTLIIRSLCERDFAPCELIEVIASKKESEEAARILLWRLVEKKIVELIVGSDNKRWLSLSRDLFGIRHQSDVKKRTDRFYNQPAKKQDERKDFERDRDRILFSSAFRRLAGVTQVVAPTESQPIHNRLTHSLKVAQIGRGLAVTLLENTSKDLIRTAGDLDPFVVEAAGLAHDLGHPPFGHIAESELNRLVGEAEASILLNCKEENGISSEDLEDLRKQLGDGFEGYAQSFRIITTLSSRFHDLKGLDLTRATLCAVLKYPWVRNDSQAQPLSSEKWGAYTSEAKYLRWARELSPSDGQVRSLEAALMDWADDIAYAVHDLEDFYRAGLIPLDRLASSAHERTVFLQHENERQQKKRILPGSTRDDLAESFQRLMCVAPFKGPFAGTHRERAVLRAFTSTLIGRCARWGRPTP
jgi:dGTPase